MPQVAANLTNTQKFVKFVKLEFNLLNFNLLVMIKNLFYLLNSVINESAVYFVSFRRMGLISFLFILHR